jgi:plasmid stabilization system protein ParE
VPARLHAVARCYTLREWGERQRDRCMALLEDACERSVPALAHLARPAPHRPELRMLRCERHVIYLRSVRRGFEIVRILHERQLPRKQL